MKTIPYLALLAPLSLSIPASAQMIDGMQLAALQADKDRFAVGALAISEPRFPGNGRHQFAFPLIDAQWRSGVFVSTLSGIGYRVDASPAVQWGVRMSADFGRSGSQDYRSIPARPELGPFVNVRLGRSLQLLTAVRYGAGSARHGLLAEGELEYEVVAHARHRLSAGLAVAYGNRQLLNEYYGAPAFGVDGGLRNATLKLRHTFQLSHSWSSYLDVRALQVLDAVRGSPLVKAHRQTTWIGGISYGW
jgi:outer membrane protein